MVRRVKVGISTLPHPPYVCFRADGSSRCDRRVRRTDCEGKHACVCATGSLLEVCISSISWPTPTVSGRREKSSRILSTSWSRPCRRCEELTLAPSTREVQLRGEPQSLPHFPTSPSTRTSPDTPRYVQLLSSLITMSGSCSNFL